MPVVKIENEKLLEQLTRVFQQYGYEGASLSRISEATGLERASLYHRFPGGKDQMAEAVLEHVAGTFEEVLSPLYESGSLAARIRESGRRLQEFYEDGSVSCVLDTLSLRAGSRALHEAIGRAYSAWREAFAAAAREAGFPSVSARRRAEEAIMSIHGALVLARATGDKSPFRRVIARLPDLLTGVREGLI
jgi:TetR/AcrR family transcriptional repressor of lmrAB and yxaGH operons